MILYPTIDYSLLNFMLSELGFLVVCLHKAKVPLNLESWSLVTWIVF